MKRWIKKLIKLSIALGVLSLALIFFANYTIEKQAKGKVFDSVQQIPNNKVGLVLGTSKLLSNGNKNLYFIYRINAVAELYKAGKIQYVLVSGDNGVKSYDEPTDFKEALIQKGIPEDKIYLDYAGFRTLDSVVRAKEIFGQEELTFISQEFHNERAIYIAHKNNMKAIGYNAKEVSPRYGLRVQLREYLARVKVFIDLIFGVEPKFLGDKIEIAL